MAWRALAAFALTCIAATLPAWAAQMHVPADLDLNLATGCTVATPGGPVPGLASHYITMVDTTVAPPMVTGITRETCVDPTTSTFSAPVLVSSGGWPVGVGLGVGGSNAIESGVPLPAGITRLRVGFVYIDPVLGNDALLS